MVGLDGFQNMFMILAVAALLVLQAAAQPTEDPKCQYAWASIGTSRGDLHIHDGKPGQGAVAWGSFQNDIHISGWTFLEVQSNGSYADDAQAYAAGAVEAYLTHDLMEKQFNNMYSRYCEGQPQYCERLYVFLLQNLGYSNIQENLHESTDPYWHMVHLQMKQLAGLSDQFENKTLIASNEYLDITRALFLNIEGDLLDLEKVLKRVPDEYSMDQTPACSALIKVLADNDDILFAHNTWFGYRKMLRIEKKYTFPWQLTSKSSDTIPGHTISMSSYPGKLVSLDDFYLASTGLAITETTIENSNDSLWNLVRPDSAPLTWVRGMVATRLAVTSPQWVDYFGKLNSGTYNNQWMVLDYKLFAPGSAIGKNTLWILEQMPNITKAKDVSAYLQNQKYWGSYNVAFFPAIFNISGQPDMVKKYGNYYSYDMSPRAKIFRREQSKVEDVDTMLGLMRYNNYTHDPASRCNCTPPYNPVYAIAARYDLLDPKGRYDVPYMFRRAGGAIDMKLTNYAMFKSLEFIAINGPPFHPNSSVLPPFQWSTSGFQDLHEGHPDKWMFGPTYHRWNSSPNL
ncbi:putative phospholipase B-like 2 isoform X1 [Ixodes scapularis]|uniref:putative phospholipase B-like 2 isoform X1 n=2 Tax=Ixodes scapularis TaxID=6945 RepID=UPI001A9FE388|nr:putative phospholipase B-like 2 isoform X1 [Ixodes scapularis]